MGSLLRLRYTGEPDPEFSFTRQKPQDLPIRVESSLCLSRRHNLDNFRHTSGWLGVPPFVRELCSNYYRNCEYLSNLRNGGYLLLLKKELGACSCCKRGCERRRRSHTMHSCPIVCGAFRHWTHAWTKPLRSASLNNGPLASDSL